MTIHINATLADDTQEIIIPTRAIVQADFMHGLEALNGHLVQYRHHSDSRKLYLGHIAYVTNYRRGIAIYVQPVKGYRDAKLMKSFVMGDVRLVGGAAMNTVITTATGIIVLNLPAFVAACPFRIAVYRSLVVKATWQFTDDDRRAWAFATGWHMPRITATPLTVKWGALPK
jgi:hypothetical protein